MRQDTNYAYAVARIKVLENKLLKSSDLDALLSTDPVSLVDSLAAFGYPSSNRVSSEADDIDSQDILTSYTEKLSDYFADTVRSVMTFSPEPEVLSCFLIPADYNNLKICVKTIANYREDIDNDLPALSKNGNVDPESLWNAFITFSLFL